MKIHQQKQNRACREGGTQADVISDLSGVFGGKGGDEFWDDALYRQDSLPRRGWRVVMPALQSCGLPSGAPTDGHMCHWGC